MKKIIATILITIGLYSCEEDKRISVSTNPSRYKEEIIQSAFEEHTSIITIDSCEYIFKSYSTTGVQFIHKANCKKS
jgi:hypothetical protein